MRPSGPREGAASGPRGWPRDGRSGLEAGVCLPFRALSTLWACGPAWRPTASSPGTCAAGRARPPPPRPPRLCLPAAPASQNGPSSGNGAAPPPFTQAGCSHPVTQPLPAARSGPPGSSPPAPTSKRDAAQGLAVDSDVEEHSGLTSEARQRRGSGVAASARRWPRRPPLFYSSSSPAYSRSRASTLANRNHGSVEMTAWLAYGRMAPEEAGLERACVLGDAGKVPARRLRSPRCGVGSRASDGYGDGDQAWRSPCGGPVGTGGPCTCPASRPGRLPIAQGATEANAGLKVAPPAKVAWSPGSAPL